MDINELLEDKDNGLVPLDGRSYDIAAYAGQLRQARNILLGSLPAETVACMSDTKYSKLWLTASSSFQSPPPIKTA